MSTTPLDLDQLAQIREERFQLRRIKHQADRWMPAGLRDLYLDREIVTDAWIIEFLGLTSATSGRISRMRDGTSRIVPTSLAAAMRMRPTILPGLDVCLSVAYGRRIRIGIEKGRIIEWAIKDHRVLWNPATGELTPNLNFRQGRPRHNRPTLGPAWISDPKIRKEARAKIREQGKHKTD